MITVSKLKEYAKDVKVLYVEDEKSIQEEICDFLSRFFPVIDLADDGEAGLELYKTKDYDIVISDINMPKMNGIEMVKEIKEINENQKIIITSAYNEPQYLMELIDSGVDKFVLKPFNNKKFLLVLYNLCESVYTKRQEHLLQLQIEKKNAQTQTILNIIEHGIVVIDDGKIVEVNQQFLEMAGYENQEVFYQEINDIPSLFESHKGYIDVSTNKELISILESKDCNLYKIVMKIDDRLEVYLLKYKKVTNEDRYVVSFTDITDEESLVNVNTKTGLPNVYAATAEIEYRLSKSNDFTVSLVSIQNVQKMIKWHGVDIKNNHDKNVAEVIKQEKEIFHKNSIFVSYYGYNKFLLISDGSKQSLIDNLLSKISSISAMKNKVVSVLDKSDIFYNTVNNTMVIEATTEIESVLKTVDKEFEKMLF